MTGLDKMKSQILKEAQAAADAKISEAESQAKEILDAAKAETDKAVAAISQKSEADAANLRDRVASSIDLQRRTQILTAKQEVIAEILDKAYVKLTSMGSEEYFQMLAKLLEKYVLPQDGQICFSQADLDRMPESFKAQIDSVAKAKGGNLSISQEGRKIENGFILVYGGVEENCTLRAVFDAKKDELSDKIHRFLFV